MKFGIAFSNVGPFCEPDMLGFLARTGEDCGFESMWTVEHSVVPVGYKSEYPYDKSGRMPGGEDAPIPDPLLPLAFAAALTNKIRLATGVMILPQRHPIYVAKEVATLDVLSNGRAILGIGVGWLEEEFEALGVPFKNRGSRTKEAVKAIRQLWGPGTDPFEGEFFKWGALESNPKPVQKGGVPIVVGGHSDLAAKRAARYGDGFFPAREEARTMELLGIMRAECERIGRDPSEIECTTILPSFEPDELKRIEAAGISRCMIAPPGETKDDLKAGLEGFADAVISKL